MQNNLLKKFLSFSYGSVVGAAIAFITTMITTRILQPEEFGRSSMFTLFVNISMIIAVFGTDQTFVRFFYEESKEKRGNLLYNCLKVTGIILIPVLIIVSLFREELLEFLFSEYNFYNFIILIVAIVIQVFYRFGTLVVRMQQKGNLYSILEVSNKVLMLISVIVFYLFLGSTYEILIYSTVSVFTILVLFLIISQKEFWTLDNLKGKSTIHSKSEIFTFSYPLVFTTAVMWIFEGLDKFAIRQWANYNELGLYSAAFKIIGLLGILKIAFTTFWSPVAYQMFQKDPKNTPFYANVSKLVAFLMMMVGVLVIMMKDIIIMLIGAEYEKSSLMLSFLVFIPIMYTISETTVLGINFYKKVKWHIIIATIVCLLNFLGNWWLVPKFGAIGASISTGISYILFFTLRTVISLFYYKVNYGLSKVYLSTAVLVAYASYTLMPNQFINEQVIGFVAIFIITLLYFRDIKSFVNIQKGVSQ